MFKFFENLPNEIILSIFKLNSRSDQARLAQTCQKFNKIIADNHLKLNKYKFKHSVCTIGDVTVVLKKNDYPFSSQLWLTCRNNNKPYSPLSIPSDEAEKIVSAMEKGSASLLTTLNEIKLINFIHDIEELNIHMKIKTQSKKIN